MSQSNCSYFLFKASAPEVWCIDVLSHKIGQALFRKRSHQLLQWFAAIVIFVSCFGWTDSRAQFIELRSPFEKFSDWRVLAGGSFSTPPNSQWDEGGRYSAAVSKKTINANQFVSVEYGTVRAGLNIYNFPGTMLPYVIWNPQFTIAGEQFGGDSSRWAISLRAEDLFGTRTANEFLGDGQSDKSEYPDRNSFSFLITRWIGAELDTADIAKLFRESAGMMDLSNESETNVHYSTRNGLSVGIGLGSGKYAGSGPISQHLNFFSSYNTIDKTGFSGINPLLVTRYRLRNLITELDVAGDDVNLNFILRNLKRLDIETGIIHLEHIFPRSTRGPHRPEAFVAARYAITSGKDDGYFEYGDATLDRGKDTDGDGISDMDETLVYHTNPYSPDTDGDGLNDGEEIKTYKTNPLSNDTDGDGLSDGEEVRRFRTSPRLVDTDGDGLTDGEEIMKYNTNALKRDTDGDGLSDGDEIKIHNTDPLKEDTDGDGLTDGDEILVYHTNPKLVDTDGDGLSDGYEVNTLGTDPLKVDTDGDGVPDNVDNCPLTPGVPEEQGCPAKPKLGSRLQITGIVFETGKSTILPESEVALRHADSILNAYPTIRVSIQGHTDNQGDPAKNKSLSKDRAEAVKTWLVEHGINASRLETRGYGQDRPIAPNTTEEGRQQNRRIEFLIVDDKSKK